MLPLTVAVDQNAALVQHPIQQKGSAGLDSLEPGDIYPTGGKPTQTVCEFKPERRTFAGEKNEKIEIRALILIAPRHRAVKNRESHTALGSKRSTKRPQQLPVAAQILGLTWRETKSARPSASSSQRALSRRAAQGSLFCPKVCSQLLKDTHIAILQLCMSVTRLNSITKYAPKATKDARRPRS